MGDTFDNFDGRRASSQAKRARNREVSARLLLEAGVRFETNNLGLHLIVEDEGRNSKVDFWPGTGLWRSRLWHVGRKSRGVNELLTYLGKGDKPWKD